MATFSYYHSKSKYKFIYINIMKAYETSSISCLMFKRNSNKLKSNEATQYMNIMRYNYISILLDKKSFNVWQSYGTSFLWYPNI
jgi:hypothetical protein